MSNSRTDHQDNMALVPISPLPAQRRPSPAAPAPSPGPDQGLPQRRANIKHVNYYDKERTWIVMMIWIAMERIKPSPNASATMVTQAQYNVVLQLLDERQEIIRVRRPHISAVRGLLSHFLVHKTANKIRRGPRARIPREAIEFLLHLGWSTRRIEFRLSSWAGGENKVSRETVRLVAKELKMRWYKETKAHQLTAEKAFERLEWCLAMKHNFATKKMDHRNIFFTDEAWFRVGPYYHAKNSGRFFIRYEQQPTLHGRRQGGEKIMVFGGFHHKYGAFGPYFIPDMGGDTLNGQRYANFLRLTLIPEMQRRMGNEFYS